MFKHLNSPSNEWQICFWGDKRAEVKERSLVASLRSRRPSLCFGCRSTHSRCRSSKLRPTLLELIDAKFWARTSLTAVTSTWLCMVSEQHTGTLNAAVKYFCFFSVWVSCLCECIFCPSLQMLAWVKVWTFAQLLGARKFYHSAFFFT